MEMAPLNTPLVDPLSELRSFIYGATRGGLQNVLELTKVAINLLKSFPAAREAVLEYFAMVFHDAVSKYMNQSEYEGMGNLSMEAVAIISPALCELSVPWSQILAPWSINLLKAIAGSNTSCPTSVLQNCEAVRALLDVATVSLSRLDGPDHALCIDMMLGSSQCDWVVGHVGRSDPSLVVPRALELALQNSSPQNLDHVVSILTHLSPLHFTHIRQALLKMFEDSLNIEPGDADRRRAIIPYLMQLASKSDIVLKALTKDINVTSSVGMLEKLCRVCGAGIGGLGGAGAARAALVSLCLRSDAPVFLLLLDWAPQNPFCRELLENLLQKMETDIRCSELKIPLLDSIAADISNIRRKLIFGTLLEKYSIARVAILISFQSTAVFTSTFGYLLQNSQDDKTLALLVRIISGTLSMRATLESNEQFPECNRILSLVRQAHENALREAMNAVTHPEGFFQDDKKLVKSRQQTCLERFCHNTSTLLRWENTGKVIQLLNKPINKICEANLNKLATVFNELVSVVTHGSLEDSELIEEQRRMKNSMFICHAMANMLDLINVSNNLNNILDVEIVMKITRANVKYFFRCLHEEDVITQMKGTQTAYRIFRRMCSGSKVARSVALRELLETALFREAETFGAKLKDSLENNANFENSRDELLMFQNHKQAPLTQLTQSHTSVFHAGIIGKGARKIHKPNNNANASPQDQNVATISKSSREVELLLGAIMACMDANGDSLDGMTCVSLLLVELVSPDVMYNGLPWPDEDFTKVSIERELYIRQVFDGYPLVWHLIRMISLFRPALCYCSVLLRAVVATLIQQYGAKSDKYNGSDDDNLNEVTIELLDIMYRGQLLPAPLNYISKMIPHLKPVEIVQLLRDCVWNYKRDNVPSPALFTRDATGLHWRDPSQSKPLPQYTDTLRVLIQKNIATLGHLYPLMFLDMHQSENNMETN